METSFWKKTLCCIFRGFASRRDSRIKCVAGLLSYYLLQTNKILINLINILYIVLMEGRWLII